MGKFNSSIYRVRPLMEVVEKDYGAFLRLLSMVGIPALDAPTAYNYDGVHCSEKQLKPSKQHLSSLIRYIAKKDHGTTPVKNERRKALYFASAKPDSRDIACQKALAALEAGYASLTAASNAWYIFEGFTSPDIFIEGDDYVIVCEGKWTEPHITVKTTNLSAEGEYRNQMIRHIQGALHYTDKKVYAFYIVDADCGYEDDLTKENFVKQLELETIQPEPPEKAAILDAFRGYTTWQAIAAAIPDISFPSKQDIQ